MISSRGGFVTVFHCLGGCFWFLRFFVFVVEFGGLLKRFSVFEVLDVLFELV